MVIYLIIIGAAAGFIATRLMKVEANIVITMAIGIGGALIGGLLLRVLLSVLGIGAGLVGAILGAVLLIWLYQTYIQKNGPRF
ncbi:MULTISPECIES: GlsB/YeaQ/YmgE family stress response membrane protein [Halocynthiibacter]|uniref:GlsB/YeaQ/YmgE family stress response membrane protein n=1 Tax=Halocynthiibacter halioticoli TaxID=2986804 RepID=A0AAE3IY40_9RHOB|nr:MULTISPECIES: GlsB/YeaQ/YmgE family stress response membrane protein [Halocynthiibacter]MCV6823250.1 GlsB/YeaQ/YmgE family stress response membrane protein [Halocynthiibacter halioticoli]MCW4056251.1 GlsB/YeaQ/YmgE family stress response membrane protein [Halocynthiibacter sp. SDUM655004]MDE0590783.1 GlsB/YeaQ/YmgE family stress response membrane protein [Halocynthiibacter sp. C4]